MEKELVGMMITFLQERRSKYEAQGLIPTLDLLIEDLTEIQNHE